MDLSENDKPKPRIRGILVVFIIVLCAAVLTSLILPNIMDLKMPNKTKALTTQTLITNLERSLYEYAENNPFGRYPDASYEFDGNGTMILVSELINNNLFQFNDTNLSSRKPYQLLDGWGRPMRYHPWKREVITDAAHNKCSYDLWSAGADGEFGTADDITNWSIIVEEEEIEGSNQSSANSSND